MKKILLPLLMFMFLTAGPVHATTVPKMDLSELVKTAESIVQGRVARSYPEWDEQLKVVFTYTEILVDDPIKGGPKRTLTMKHIGGRKPNSQLSLTVAGIPQFRIGDEVIVFLTSLPDGTFQVVGLNQGKFDITDDFAVSNISGVEVMDPKTGKITPGGFVARVGVAELKAKIREMVK